VHQLRQELTVQKNRQAHAASHLSRQTDRAAQQSPASRAPVPLDPKVLPQVGGGAAPRNTW
jgi:hypothetical protein